MFEEIVGILTAHRVCARPHRPDDDFRLQLTPMVMTRRLFSDDTCSDLRQKAARMKSATPCKNVAD
jgi:hypothetical protein